MDIAIIGGGVMGEAIASGLISKGHTEPGAITVSDIDESRLQILKERYGVRYVSDNRQAIENKDMVVLSIKPQAFNVVSDGLHGIFEKKQLVLSIIAGMRIETLSKQLGHDSIVRVMPNNPAQIGEGISVWTATESVTLDQKELARTVLNALGKEIYVSDEKYIDMATAVSGSGPAYILLVMEALTEAAVHIGMPREMALELVMQTVLGTARFAESSGKPLAQLRNMVTSPGGTTAEGLLELEKGGLRASLIQAVIIAHQKIQTLGKEQK